MQQNVASAEAVDELAERIGFWMERDAGFASDIRRLVGEIDQGRITQSATGDGNVQIAAANASTITVNREI